MKLLLHGIGIYRTEAKFGPARWRHHDLLAVREGEIDFRTPRSRLRLAAGDAVWIPPGVEFHGASKAERSTIWVIHFRDKDLKPANFIRMSSAGVGIFRSGIESSLAFELMKRLDELYQGENCWDQAASAYFLTLLAEAKRNHLRRKFIGKAWTENLEQWARCELSRGLGARELAQHVSLSESYFRQQFRRERGLPVGRYLRQLRLQEAETLLRESSLSLKEISARVGYADVAAFHRAFSHVFQLTPTNFRKRTHGLI